MTTPLWVILPYAAFAGLFYNAWRVYSFRCPYCGGNVVAAKRDLPLLGSTWVRNPFTRACMSCRRPLMPTPDTKP